MALSGESGGVIRRENTYFLLASSLFFNDRPGNRITISSAYGKRNSIKYKIRNEVSVRKDSISSPEKGEDGSQLMSHPIYIYYQDLRFSSTFIYNNVMPIYFIVDIKLAAPFLFITYC